jgi:bifunctional DNase/RNase
LKHDESAILPLKVFKVMQSKFYTLFILEGPQKKIPIYTEPQVGLNIQDILSSQTNARPKTFDLLQLILQGLDAKPLKAMIYDFDNNVYKAHLFLEQKQDNKEIMLKIDSRPSDCLTLALMADLPLFCHEEAFKKAPSFDLQ